VRARSLLLSLAVLWIGYATSRVAEPLSAQRSEKAALTLALQELRRTIYSLRPQERDQAMFSSVSRSVDWFIVQTNAWIPRTPDEGGWLRQSIERMTRAIRSAADTEQKTELLRLLSEDLNDKLEFCRLHGLTGRRRVDVVTKRDGVVEVKGLEVLYLEKFLANDPKATPQQFRGFSSPAVDDLVPGRYVFWAKEPGRTGKSGARKDGRVAVDSPQGPIEVLTP
jgi:hypothetical protein